MQGLQETLLSLATTPWILLVVFGLCVIDGFFPPLPSESIIIAVTALAAAADSLGSLPLIVAVAALGATVGDNIAYWMGHSIDIRARVRFFSHGRGATVLAWAQRTFAEVGGPLIIAGRYVPVGRVAVNMVAGTVRYRHRTFFLWDLAACVLWACYTVVIGLAAGAWFHDHPIWGAIVGIAIGIAFGLVLSRVVTWVTGRKARATAAAAQQRVPAVSDAE